MEGRDEQGQKMRLKTNNGTAEHVMVWELGANQIGYSKVHLIELQSFNLAMSGPVRRHCAQCVTTTSTSNNSVSLPSFLLPAFQPASPFRSFATSSPRLSKIGKAPLSIPPEVTFNVITHKQGSNGRISRTQPTSTVHIRGPLGK